MSEAKVHSVASATDLVVRYGTHTVLDEATIAIHENDRVGLVGRNGAGKSTFLKIAAGDFEPDSGSFVFRKDLVVGYLPQNFDLKEEESVLQNVLSGAPEMVALLSEYDEVDPESDRSADLIEEITLLDGWNLEQRAQSLINNLHAPNIDRIVNTLSGGERRRVGLCRALLAEPDFLILDEPTNHLDTEAIEWLESYLAKYRGTCLFVTHDRYFLDRISTRIIEVAAGKLNSYEGNYGDYLLARAERDAVSEKEEHKRQKFLKKELDWVRRRPKARGTKAKDRIDRFFETKEQDGPEEELDVELIIPPAGRLSNRILEAEEISKSLGGKTLFHNLSMKLEGGERLGIVGRNGLGKSTLLKVLLNKMEADSGLVTLGAKTDINYVDQDRLTLDDQKSIHEEVGEGSDHVQLGNESIGIRAYLRRFLFDDDRINTKIELLSGGERSRVLLAKILKRGGNVLVLDEPTNDLDLATLRILEEALLGFKGTVLVVSHDRYFLNRICTGILGFEGHGEVIYQVGNYDYYLDKKKEREVKNQEFKVKEKPQKGAKKERSRKLKWAEEKELETMEDDIMKAETAVSELETKIAAPNFYEKHSQDWEKLENELKENKVKVTAIYARWEELEEIKAAAEA